MLGTRITRLPVRMGFVRAPFSFACARSLSSTPAVYRTPSKKRPRPRERVKSPPLDPRISYRLRLATRHELFHASVLLRFNEILKQMNESEVSTIGVGLDEMNHQATVFVEALDEAFMKAEKGDKSRERNLLFWTLKEAFVHGDMKGLRKEIQYSFQSFLIRQRFPKDIEAFHRRLLDFRFPHEWYPATRAMQRTIHVHVGPTNSGKTYNALKALENSKCGVYAGPLRLLATEVYQRLKAKGRPCALLTGEEIRIPDDTDRYFSSCTVEMTPLNERYDVAVIDEIQMISDPSRGNAWTSALLGVQAKEVHLCGEDRAVPLIQAICASIGDECIVHQYQRLSPLETMDSPVGGNWNNLEKGDAVVAFSRKTLHQLKRAIELKTGRRCAIIYGSLPPEVRQQQAALFNDPNNDYDFVVASDAIGMGLNLEVRRVILESIVKYDGSANRNLSNPEIKQIGGRAGRYRTAQSAIIPGSRTVEENKVGYVTALDGADLRGIRKAFEAPAPDLQHAYISAPAAVIERYSTYFPKGTPLSFILGRIKELAGVGAQYSLCSPTDMMEIADIVEDLPLTIYDRLTLCNIPISMRAERSIEVLRALATIIAHNRVGSLLDIKEIPLEFLDIDLKEFEGRPADYLYKLESLHTAMNQYIWLSYRYSGMFRDQALAFHVRTLIEERLVDTLDKLDFTDAELEKRRTKRRLAAHSHQVQREAMGENDLDELEQEQDDPPLDDDPTEVWRHAEELENASQQSESTTS